MIVENTPMPRIVVVSNRLPFTVVQSNGGVQFDQSVGGVATGLRSFLSSMQSPAALESKYVWVGWPGTTISDEVAGEVRSRSFREYQSHPVFLSEQDFENFYQGFCNKTIWPIFHYFPSYARYEEEYWRQYQKVNQAFSEALLEVIEPQDVLWIHDYHLMLLPSLLRKKLPNVRIGFFLHIPFPHFEIFRLLPEKWRRGILQGLLGADLIGFHAHDYMEYFLGCVQRVLGYKPSMGRIMLGGRMIRSGVFPMGIDFRKFYATASSPHILKETAELAATFGDSKVILSVDRQDYTKGIINRLRGFEWMLEMNPAWHGKVTLAMIVVPSRIGIEQYEGTKKQIEELVGKINGEFGTLGWVPINYQYRSLLFDSLVAVYAASHIALLTPLRDGMNLVAKEYVASRPNKTGVLILSEMAGAARELTEAIIINPNDAEEIAEALRVALEMPPEEQIRRNQIMQNKLRSYDVNRWAKDFLDELVSNYRTARERYSIRLAPSDKKQLIQAYHRSAQRLLLLDHDGTMAPLTKRLDLAAPTGKIVRLLSRLGSDTRNDVVLVTGRDRATLQHWFGLLPIHLVAEHGAFIRERGGNWRMPQPLVSDWKSKILPILEKYANRAPGAFVEEKEFCLVWHYRAVEDQQGTLLAGELADDLLAATANTDLQILPGNKIVEVRNRRVNKGVAVQHWLSRKKFDFVLAIGDDRTDEDTFAVLPGMAYSIRIGNGRTRARFSLRDPGEVVSLLEELLRKHRREIWKISMSQG